MKLERKQILVALVGAALVVALAGGAIAYASGDGEETLTGPEADRAANAALEITGGGTVLAVERDDSGAAWEVEVRRDDGSEVEVRLDASYGHVTSGADDSDAGESGGETDSN